MNEEPKDAEETQGIKRQWTPGPWIGLGCIHGDGPCRCGSICAEFGASWVVANVKSQGGVDPLYDSEVPPLNEARANAHLIAAAPELFEALAEAVRMYGSEGGPWNVPSHPGSWIAQAKAAIAKALGGQDA